MRCPLCHEEMRYESYDEEYHGVVEAWDTCTECRICIGHSYGYYQILFDDLVWGWSYKDDGTEREKAWEECEMLWNILRQELR